MTGRAQLKFQVRPQWYKPNPVSNNDTRAPIPPIKPIVTMPPIAASSQSRNKLRNLQYDQENAPQKDGKATDKAIGIGEGPKSPSRARDSQAVQVPVPLQQHSLKAGRNESKDCPQTPGGRLPLAELIASGEDYNQVLNLTPVERVLWNNSARNSEQGSSQETPALPKSRKRAHSSSPISSSQKKHRTSDFFTTGEKSIDVQHLQKALKTPQGDPAGDLWKKYSLNAHGNERLSPTRAFGQPFSQLLESSSPQTPARKLLGRESAGLRRSFSCGTEWPTSTAKRRRLQATAEDSPHALAAVEEGVQKSQKCKSRLSLLVAKISGDLARPATDAGEQTAASAPYREDTTPAGHPISSEAHLDEEDERGQYQSSASQRPTTPRGILGESRLPDDTPLQDRTHLEAIDAQSDDFGDDGLDLETFDAVDAEIEARVSQLGVITCHSGNRITGKVPSQGTKSTGTAMDSRDKTVPRSALGKPQDRPSDLRCLSASAPSKELNRDEFDNEDANDVSAEDFEDAIALFDQKAEVQLAQNATTGRHGDPAPSQKRSTIYGSSPEGPQLTSMAKEQDRTDPAALSEDEFGGDLEFEDIVAECEKATQGQPSTSQLCTNVCIRRFGSST